MFDLSDTMYVLLLPRNGIFFDLQVVAKAATGRYLHCTWSRFMILFSPVKTYFYFFNRSRQGLPSSVHTAQRCLELAELLTVLTP
jgi:hypothetical protein